MNALRRLASPTNLFLLAIFFIAFFLRAYLLNKNLFFGPEQGIDFLKIKDIVLSHNITLIGPKTDIAGVFHGPFYYYVMAVPFLLFFGNPLLMAYFFILLNALTVIFIYYAAKEMFSERAGFFASVFFAVSYGTIAYSHWLSGHGLTLPLSALLLLFSVRYLKSKDSYLIVCAALLALIGQAAFLNFLFVGAFAIIFLVVFRKRFLKTTKKILVLSFLIAGFLALTNFVLFDLTHNFLISKNLILLLKGQTGFHQTFSEALSRSAKMFADQMNFFLLPHSKTFLAPLLLFTLAAYSVLKAKDKSAYIILLSLILIPLAVLVGLKQNSLEQFFVLTAVPAIILTCGLIDKYITNKFVFTAACAIVIGVNSIFYLSNYSKNIGMFFQAPQPQLNLLDEKNIIAKAVEIANGKSYYYQAFTIPYWEQQGWDYLFWYYSKNNPPKQQNRPDKLFVIIQRTPGNPDAQAFEDNWLSSTVSNWGNRKHLADYGILSLEEINQE